MTNRQSPKKTARPPYAILAGLAGLVVVLLVGVVIFGLRHRSDPTGPQLVAFWLAQTDQPAADRRDVILLLAEDQARGTLTVLVLPARVQVGTGPVALLPDKSKGSGRKQQAALQQVLGVPVHHYAVLDAATIRKLVDMTGGLTVNGQRLDGAQTVAFLFGEADVARRMERAPQLLLGIMEAAGRGQFQGGLSDLMALADGVETDLSMLDLPGLFGRWAGYVPHTAVAPGRPQPDGTWALDNARLTELLQHGPAAQ